MANMTNDEGKTSFGIEDDKPAEVSWTMPVQDAILTTLVDMTEAKAIRGMGLTVNVRGQVITGILVSRDHWFAEVLRIAEGDGTGIIDQIRDAYGDEGVEEPMYLHFINGQLVSSESVARGSGAQWRVRIGDVSSWAFGQMSSS